MPGPTVADEILDSRQRAHAKHGDNSIEAMHPADPRWLAVLVEEVGEVAHELTYDADRSGRTEAEALRAELVDVLAVAWAWVDAIDRAIERTSLPAATKEV